MNITLDIASKEYALQKNNLQPGNLDEYVTEGKDKLLKAGFPDKYKIWLDKSLSEFSQHVIKELINETAIATD